MRINAKLNIQHHIFDYIFCTVFKKIYVAPQIKRHKSVVFSPSLVQKMMKKDKLTTTARSLPLPQKSTCASHSIMEKITCVNHLNGLKHKKMRFNDF